MVKLDMLRETKSSFIAKIESLDDICRNLDSEVVVSQPLSPKDALGKPSRDDFPLFRGKEVLMQAIYRGFAGQAFTAASGSFQGSLGDVLELPLQSAFDRAVLVSTINAVLRCQGLIERTVHCKDEGPKRCADCMAEWVKEQHVGNVGLVGMQPALLEALVQALGPEKVMVSDLAKAGSVQCNVMVLDGMHAEEMFEHCQLILMTGSALANGTIDAVMDIAEKKECRVVYYGTTIAGAAYLLDLERWCPCSA